MVAYKGKFKHQKNPYRDRKEHKSDEIKKSLTHRARLRKNYFKLLEKEGIPETKREDRQDSHQQEGDNSEDDEQDENSSKLPAPKYRERKPLDNSTKKPMNFAERAKLAKERKEQNRKDKLQAIKERREQISLRVKEREYKKERLTKRTRSGQPLMGPRINNLLDKIKSDM